jgi:hypothetical protein
VVLGTHALLALLCSLHARVKDTIRTEQSNCAEVAARDITEEPVAAAADAMLVLLVHLSSGSMLSTAQ